MTDDQRLGPPPVEPMSDVAWSRIERGLWARMDADAPTVVTHAAPGRRWWLAVAPLAVAAAVLALVLALRPTSKVGPTRS